MVYKYWYVTDINAYMTTDVQYYQYNNFIFSQQSCELRKYICRKWLYFEFSNFRIENAFEFIHVSIEFNDINYVREPQEDKKMLRIGHNILYTSFCSLSLASFGLLKK